MSTAQIEGVQCSKFWWEATSQQDLHDIKIQLGKLDYAIIFNMKHIETVNPLVNQD
jgi:CTP:phosphocholine cytidylyltransferase-like protein